MICSANKEKRDLSADIAKKTAAYLKSGGKIGTGFNSEYATHNRRVRKNPTQEKIKAQTEELAAKKRIKSQANL